ncbi:hypothetical protein FHU38_004462 [Saccharomonospora amisosensis]|uniref:Uncharacterized protein n=1 Tax=Saccharomonospora amisosensis TaxID=1128677 RepID=A0A7X5UTW5_9PSEU|nr:hypothetical protein [Saccharomonospora amisosensis]
MNDEYHFGGSEWSPAEHRSPTWGTDPWVNSTELSAQQVCPVIPLPRTSPENHG